MADQPRLDHGLQPDKSFQCPADNFPAGSTPAAGSIALSHSYAPNGPATGPGAAGIVVYYFPGLALGKSNYAGVAGACFSDAVLSSPFDGPGANLSLYQGFYTNRSKGRVTDATDGSSNTLMFGEGLGGARNNRDFQWTWVGTGAIPTKFGIPDTSSNAGYQYFCSNHSAGLTYFCFGDGSVRGLRPSGSTQRNPAAPIWYIYQAMSGMRDGQTVDMSQMSN